MKPTKEQIQHSIDMFKRVQSGDGLYTCIHKVNANCTTGSAWLRVYAVVDGQIENFTHHAANIGGYSLREIDCRWMLNVKGYGFNRGADVVDSVNCGMRKIDASWVNLDHRELH